MDSDRQIFTDGPNFVDLSKIIDSEIAKIEERFLIKMDQRIIDHMKNEWENSKFNMSLYALQKQIDKLTTRVECNSIIVADLCRKVDCDESEC